MKKQFLILLAIFLVQSFTACPAPSNVQHLDALTINSAAKMEAGEIFEANNVHRNLPQVEGSGIVVKVLKDDT